MKLRILGDRQPADRLGQPVRTSRPFGHAPGDLLANNGQPASEQQLRTFRRVGRDDRLDAVPDHERQIRISRVAYVLSQVLGNLPSDARWHPL